MQNISERYEEIPVEDRPHRLDNMRMDREPNVLIVGAGGTGGFFAESLCRLMTGRRAVITIIDHDVVEQHNLLRQNFYPEDVGQPKSMALATRLSRQYQRPISYSTVPVSVERSSIRPTLDHRPNLIVSCVDNAEARIALNKVIESFYDTWLIDTGNGDEWGQALIGNTTSNHYSHRSFRDNVCRRLPTPLIQRPDLAIDPPDHRPDIDCAAALDLTDQDPTINQLMASLTIQMVRRLIAGTLTYMSVYADQAAGTVIPTHATPRAASRLLNVPVDELLGRTDSSFYSPSRI